MMENGKKNQFSNFVTFLLTINVITKGGLQCFNTAKSKKKNCSRFIEINCQRWFETLITTSERKIPLPLSHSKNTCKPLWVDSILMLMGSLHPFGELPLSLNFKVFPTWTVPKSHSKSLVSPNDVLLGYLLENGLNYTFVVLACTF